MSTNVYYNIFTRDIIRNSKVDKCEHKNAFITTFTTDDYEGRKYAQIYCPDCQAAFDIRWLGENTEKYPKRRFINE